MHAWESVSANARCTLYARTLLEKRTHEKRYFWQPKRSPYCNTWCESNKLQPKQILKTNRLIFNNVYAYKMLCVSYVKKVFY
jgi:hypothetical protein